MDLYKTIELYQLPGILNREKKQIVRVVKWIIIRAIDSIVAQMNQRVCHIDIKIVLLHGEIKEEVYASQS